MIGLSRIPTFIRQGDTGPTRSGFDWNVQQSTGQTANRWCRRGASAWINVIACPIVVGSNTTLTKLSIVIYGTPLVTDSVLFTLQKNGSDTPLKIGRASCRERV